jgi:hydroxyacylglutathione hydrolase
MKVDPLEIPLFSALLPGLKLTVYRVTVEGKVFLFDTGVPWQAKRLLPMLDRVDYIVLTHAHLDHAGGIHVIQRKFKGAKLIADPGVVDWLNTHGLASKKGMGRLLKYYCFGKVTAHHDLSILPDFEIVPIETHGHTTPHHSFLLRPLNEVLVGDAFAVERGAPVGNRMFHEDKVLLNASARTLQNLNAKTYWTCHGGGVSGQKVVNAYLRV